MAWNPPEEPPAENTGARGLGGGNVDPGHEMHFTGKWPFGDPRNPPPENSTDNFVDTSNQLLSSGAGGEYDNMHPFKLQFFTEEDIREELDAEDPGRDQDPASPTHGEVIENKDETITEEGERRLRIYTGKLTAMISTFTYSTDKDTRNSYSLSVEDCTGKMCWDVDTSDPPDGIPDEAERTTDGMQAGGNPAKGGGDDPFELQDPVYDDGTHTHSLNDHTHEIPDHSHFTENYDTEKAICELEDPTVEKIDHFLTIGGQPTILGPVQIEPADFEDLTMTETYLDDAGAEQEREIQTGYRAQTLDKTYGRVWLVWKLDTSAPGGPIENIVHDVEIVVQEADDPHPVNPAPDPPDPPEGPVGALGPIEGNVVGVTANRSEPKDGKYALLIGTTYDPDIDPDGDDAPADDEPGGINDPASPDGIKQVIYENVYYAPLILPEKY